MSNVVIQVPVNVSPCQVEFPLHQLDKRKRPVKDKDGALVPFGERSGKGALYLRPGAVATITKAELEYIQANHPAIGVKVLREVSEKEVKAAEEVKKAAEASAPDEDDDAGDSPADASAPAPAKAVTHPTMGKQVGKPAK